MRNASLAEWIVSRFTGRDRAASIIGDLIEAKPQKNAWWFWLSVTRVLLSLAWRRLVAFVAALYAGSWAFSGFLMATHGIHAQHRPPEYPWMPVFSVLSGVGAILWIIFFYTAIRYGLRDKFTQLTLVSTAMVTALIYFWWQPILLTTCVVLSIFVVSVSMFQTDRRKAVLALLIVVTIGCGGGLFATYIATRYQTFIYARPMGDVELHAHPSIIWMGFLMYGLTVWMATTACSWMHRRLIEKRLLSSKAQ